METSTGKAFHGLEIGLRVMPGARALRVVHPGRQAITDHKHDWHCLTLHMLGSYTECYDGGEVLIAAPSAVFHPAGSPHANFVEDNGLETVSIQFDQAWLRSSGLDVLMDRTRLWIGGPVAVAARGLVSAWANPEMSDVTLGAATSRFLEFALLRTENVCFPNWFDHVLIALDADRPPSTNEIARRLDMHPAWFARAYRLAMGEGIHSTIRRKQIERATAMLRNSNFCLADIAATAGFCDQSHMNRGFRSVIGRTPLQVRAERKMLAIFDSAKKPSAH